MQGTEKGHVHAKACLAIFNALLEGSGSKIKLNEVQNEIYRMNSDLHINLSNP
jgi:hypothetical protein